MATFETLRLQPLFLADLYSDCVVALPNLQKPALKIQPESPAVLPSPSPMVPVATKPVPQDDALRLQYLGSFGKAIAILVMHEQAVHTSDENLQFLNKVLASVGLGLADVAIINVQNQAVTHALALNGRPPAAVILFGVQAHQIKLPLVLPQFQVSKWNNCQWLFAPTVESLLGEGADVKAQKMALWTALKQMFLPA